MNKLKESFLRKYGVWEYILFLAGLVLLSRSVYSFIIINLKEASFNELAFITIIFCLGTLSMSAPKFLIEVSKTIIEMIREKFLTTKKM